MNVILNHRLAGLLNRKVRIEPGDYVLAYGQFYRVLRFDDRGNYVCENVSPDCPSFDHVRTFNDLDVTEVIKANDPRLNG